MGFLDHSTNNIILDAVLTDKGRELLARNDGSFKIEKFTLGDDEIDYSIIQKYGRTIGKEKIEKNTPVFEGLTNQAQALKYKMISLSEQDLIRLPNLSLTTNSTVTLNRATLTTSTVTLEQSITNNEIVPVELKDEVYQISLSNLFLQVENDSPDSIDFNNTAFYTTPATENLPNGGTRLNFVLVLKSLTDSFFSIYGDSTGKIRTFVRITGMQSGAESTFEVQISQ